MLLAALAMNLVVASCQCPRQCQNIDAITYRCRAEWDCGKDVFVVDCPADGGTGDGGLGECLCIENGVVKSTIAQRPSRDWCGPTDATEKASAANPGCGWNLPYTY